MKLVMISDTHTMHDRLMLPEGDVLIHCGDFTSRGRIEELTDFLDWFMSQDYKYKVFICGNHEVGVERNKTTGDLIRAKSNYPKNVHYLENESVEIEGIKFHGFPYTPPFFDWAFMREPHLMYAELSKLPKDTDVLVSHGPPHGYLDKVGNDHVGSRELGAWIDENEPQLVCFGHIHEGYGQEREGNTTYINCSSCDERYRPINGPMVFEI